jgi:hypothetical protein
MAGRRKRVAELTGVTLIGPVQRDPDGFHRRLLISGLRLAPAPVQTFLQQTQLGPVIAAIGPECTGYLFSTDGLEAPESDLYRFLSAELRDGERVDISGEYAPSDGSTVRSSASFHCVDGRLMRAEERVLISPDGTRKVLLNRADLSFGNVVPFAAPATMTGFEP